MFGKGYRKRQFIYKPWFYDPVKEEFEQRVSEAKAHYHGDKDGYKPKGSFNFRASNTQPSIRENRFDRSYGQVSVFRIVMLAALLFVLVWAISYLGSY